MVNFKKLNKYAIGELLIPTRIYKFKYKDELESIYEKLYFNNLNYFAITNAFFLSILITLVAYILLYPQILVFFNDTIKTSFFHKLGVIYVTWFVLNLIMYYVTLFVYFFYKKSIFKKAEDEIEKDLPEFLDNLVSNLKGGISLEKALVKSVRLEQKALLREVTLINEKIMMGVGVITALKEFRHRFESPIIHRTFFLIEEGLKGGGNLAAPMARISQNLKRIYELNEELKAGAGGFTVVIKAISMFVAPLLFALALTLLSFIGDLFSLLSQSGDAFLSVAAIPPEFATYLVRFSYTMISLITLFSSLITSQLKNEKIYEALKYVPIYIIVSLLLFRFFSGFLLGFFGNIIS
ncbi:MAG: type II secretion system F family protein [Nanoarchaeota archaeon]|nr:type II secretion system F family protein [Nanoarchaeota archaeon]